MYLKPVWYASVYFISRSFVSSLSSQALFSRRMPPRATCSPKKTSLTVAVKKHLNSRPSTRVDTENEVTVSAKAASVRSRVSRRKKEVLPQEAPEWQQQALRTAAAAAKLDRKNSSNSRRRTASRARSAKTNKKVKGSSAKQGRRNEDGSESTVTSDYDDTASAASKHGSDVSAGNTGRRGKSKAEAKGATDTTPNKRTRKPKVAELLCPRCKLRIDEWPFCGLSGEPHVMPDGAALQEALPAAASPAS